MTDVDDVAAESSIDFLGVLRRRKGFIVLGVFLGLGAAALYYFNTPEIFRSEMEILVGQRSGSMNDGNLDEMEARGAENAELSTHIQIFTSRRIVEQAVQNEELNKLTTFGAGTNAASAAGFIRSRLGISMGGKGAAAAHTLTASFEGPNPDDCATILRAVFNQYVDYLEEHVEGTSVDALELLARLGTDHAEAVRDAERKLQEFMGTTDLLWDGNAAENIHKDRLRSIEAQLAQASTQRTAALSRLAVIDEFLKKNSGSQVGDVEFLALLGGQEADRLDRIRNITNGDPNSAAFQADAPIRSLAANSEYTEFLELVMKEEKLLEQFGDGHPSVVSVRSQMKTLRNFVDQKSAGLGAVEEIDRLKPQEMLSAFTKLLQHDIAEAEKRQEVLQLERMEELRLAKSLEADELKANALRSELSRQQSLSENTQAAIKGLNFVREYSGYSTDVIGDAEPRYSPVWPLPSSLFFQGLFGGLLVGLGMGVLADMADTTFTNPDDISRTLGVDILAHVPTFPTIREPKDGEPLLMDPSVYSFHKPGSPESEVFKILRSSVFCSMKDFSGRIVQITSPQPGDGKSTAAINFSVALAQSGRRTLLIDADMRRPRVADLGRVKRVPGLSEVLLGNLEPADAIKDTAQPNLSLVPSGRRPAAPAELLQSPEFRDLLQVYSEQFDFVIVDTPPILAVSDAAIVTELVDAVIMVLRVVKHGRSAAVRTCQIIEQHDAKLLGVVVNGFGVDRNQYGYLDKSDKYGYSYSTSSKSKSYYSDTEVEDSEPLEIEQPL